MNKLTLDDIKILGEGAQVKRLIEAKYDTLKKFHQQENPSMALKSVMDYCCNKKIHSGTFKCLVVNKLDMGWEEIVLTESQQVTKHVNEICNNIILYREESDIQLFNQLIDLCSKYKLINENVLMCRNVAKNYHYRNNNMKAIEYYNKAINLIGNQNIDTLVSLTVELAEHYLVEQYIDECENLFKKAQYYVENNKLSNAALYKYYYRRGVACNIEGKYTEAREYIEKSIQYADNNTESMSEKGAAFLSLGLVHKRQGDYEKAKENYQCSLMNFHINDIYGRISAFNNLADLYCIMGDYNQAIKFIDQAKALVERDRTYFKYLMISHTYAEIKLMIGDTSACYSFFEALKATVNSSVNKINIKKSINEMIETLDDIDLIRELYKTVNYIKENTNNDVYKDTLFACIGKIYEKLLYKEVYYV